MRPYLQFLSLAIRTAIQEIMITSQRLSKQIFLLMAEISSTMCPQDVYPMENSCLTILDLYSLNARRIALINVPPLGCLPIERTLHFVENKGECVEEINRAASGFNEGLSPMMEHLKSALPELKIVTLDYNGLILDFIQNPRKFGFAVTAEGCCGTGLIETGLLCNQLTPFTCADADKYLFFDFVHLSEKAYEIIANKFLGRDILGLVANTMTE